MGASLWKHVEHVVKPWQHCSATRCRVSLPALPPSPPISSPHHRVLHEVAHEVKAEPVHLEGEGGGGMGRTPAGETMGRNKGEKQGGGRPEEKQGGGEERRSSERANLVNAQIWWLPLSYATQHNAALHGRTWHRLHRGPFKAP